MVEARQRDQPVDAGLFAGRALREGDGDAVVGAEQQPPDVGAERPAVIGLDHHAAEFRQRQRLFLAVGIGDADAVALDADDIVGFAHAFSGRA